MTQEFNATINISTEVCIVCGVIFALPCTLREQLIKNLNSFCCPNGHKQSFTDEPDESREEKLENQNQTLEYEKEKLEASLKYYKNKANKVKK